MKRILAWILIFSFPLQSFAQVMSPFLKDQNNLNKTGFEYFVGQDLGSPLITVNLLSGVREPGVYHIPVNTDLAELLAFAGGANDSSDLTEVGIRRTTTHETKHIVYDLRESLTEKAPLITMQDHDVIRIPTRASIDSTMKWATFVATLVSIVASYALINSLNKQ